MLRDQLNYYQTLFEESPIAMWVEDFSGVMECIERYKQAGIADLRSYLHTYPAKVRQCANKLKVKNANKASLKLYKAQSIEELKENIPIIFRGDASLCLMESMLALSDGKKHFSGYGINFDLEGNKLLLRITWTIHDSLENVIVVLQDCTQMEEMRQSFEESESLFRNIFEQASDGLALLDNEGTIRLTNRSLNEILQMQDMELAGKPLWELHSLFSQRNQLEKNITPGPRLVSRLIQNIKTDSRSLQYNFKDARGKFYVHQFVIEPIYIQNQRFFTMMIKDLTAINRSELTTSMLHHISHAVNAEVSLSRLYKIIHQSIGRLLDVSNFYIALYDPQNRLITFPYMVDERDDDDSPISIDFADSLTAQIISDAQTLLLNQDEILQRTGVDLDDPTLAKNYLGTPLMQSGQVIGVLAVQSYTLDNYYTEEDKLFLESISEQIGFALHKRQSDERIKVLLEAVEQAGEGIVIFSAQGFIYYVNTVFERFIGYSRSELLDKPLEFLPFAVESRKEMQQSWMRVRSIQPWRGRAEMIHKSGNKIIMDMVVKPVVDENGALSSIVASCKDITFEIMREEQINRTQRLEAIGRLAGGIAHDFNNVLSAIVGYTELAMGDLEPESDTSMKLEEVLKSSSRAKQMISHLIAFSRQEEAQTEVFELVDHVKESVRFLSSYIPKNIEIIEKYLVSQSTVNAVAGQIHQIVINLGTNSMHAIGKKAGKLIIEVNEVSFRNGDMVGFPELDHGEYYLIKVKDTGCGIEDKIIKNIFDPYFTTKTHSEGTGLGLATSFGIIQAHKGAIRVESTVGVGTTFTIYLPKYKSAKKVESKIEIQDDAQIQGTENIMFVDDEPMLVSLFKEGLSRYGFKVEGFTDPRKALEFFESKPQKVDIVVTDTTMPYLSGVDLAEEIMAISPNTPVILCTGFTTIISAEEAKDRGIRDFVMKPFKINEIASMVRKILDENEDFTDATRFAPE